MRILNIQRMSTEDGPGLRTTVFFKGCPLRCAWCHNPESLSEELELEWLDVNCIGCGTCEIKCPQKAIRFGAEGLVFDRKTCGLCLECAHNCPTGAIEVKGRDVSAKELFYELIKDRAYFGENGGVTLSGGETTLQFRGAAELLRMLKDKGIGTAVDTCGMCREEVFDVLMPYTDLFLYDLKLYDDEAHRKFCGASNAGILRNFDYLADKVGPGKIWVRTPIIPGATDNVENISSIAKFINGRAERWELCAFNNLCKDKYRRLDKIWKYAEMPLMSKNKMEELTAAAFAAGEPAVWTGMTKSED